MSIWLIPGIAASRPHLPWGSEAEPRRWWRLVATREQFLGSRLVATSTGGIQAARVLIPAPRPDPKHTPVPHLIKQDDDDNV